MIIILNLITPILLIIILILILNNLSNIDCELEEIKKILKNNDPNNKLNEKEYLKQCEQQKNSNN